MMHSDSNVARESPVYACHDQHGDTEVTEDARRVIARASCADSGCGGPRGARPGTRRTPDHERIARTFSGARDRGLVSCLRASVFDLASAVIRDTNEGRRGPPEADPD